MVWDYQKMDQVYGPFHLSFISINSLIFEIDFKVYSIHISVQTIFQMQINMLLKTLAFSILLILVKSIISQ